MEALVDIFSCLGVPEEILSGLGMQFVSECMKEVTRLLSIRELTATLYHPTCNGLTEKLNGTMKSMLKRLCSEQPRQWHHHPFLFACHEVPQESTGFSLFELLYGRAVRGPMLILKELWTKEMEEPEVKNSYQCMFEVREKPWISGESWQLVDQLDAINKKILSTHSGRVKNQLRAKYAEKNKEVKRSIKSEKRKWLNNIASQAEEAARSQHTKTLYVLTKTLSNGSQSRQSTLVMDKHGNLLDNKKDIQD